MLKTIEVQKIIKESLEDYPINELQAKQVEDMFFSLMKETRNKDKDNILQESLVTAIMHEVSSGDVPVKILGRYGDNAHMRFFDDFLEEGVTAEIMSVFQKRGIPTGVLKGIKKGQPNNITTNTDVGNITVKAKISASPTGEEDDDYLRIYQNGVLIYEWKRIGEWEIPPEPTEEFTEPSTPKPPRPRKPVTKKGTEYKAKSVKAIITPTGTYTQETFNNGKTATRGRKGRFVSNKDIY